MKLLFIHGAPASGKRTVGAEVARLTHGRLFDNHAAVDFARTLIDFDAPGFWDLVHAARMVALGKAVEHGVPLVIQTSCYSHPADLPLVEDFEAVLRHHGGALLPVYLTCSRDTLEQRVGNADRAQRRKVTTKKGLAACLVRWNPVPVPRANCYTVDTDEATSVEAARAIIAHFGLEAIADSR
jgi:hypothetical protein